MMKISAKILLLAPFALFCGCTNSGTAGSTTETENAIALRDDGMVSIQVFSGNQHAANAAYKVLPSWYITDTTGVVNDSDYIYAGVTDSTGRIIIENHIEGAYTIEIEQGDSSIAYQYTLNNLNKEFNVSKAKLAKKGAVKGELSVPEDASHAWVHVPGIGRVAKTDSAGNFIIEDLPKGSLTLTSWNAVTQECIAQAQIDVPENDTLDLGHVLAPDEKVFKRTQKVNPSNLISSWMRPISIPYVLVMRLDSTNFDFSQAKEDGSDIHLLDADGKELPIEIDGWDTSIHSATINIRIEDFKDTVGVWTLEWGDIYAPAQKKSNVWNGISDSLMYELNTIEIFNFDSNSYKNDLPAPLTRNTWYLQAEEGATLTDTAVAKDYHKSLQKDPLGVLPGLSAHFEYKAEHPEYILMGTRLTNHPHDFSRLDSVIVWIRGDGEFEIILETLDDELNYKCSHKGTALPIWQRLVLTPEDFDYKIRDYHGWDVTRNKITNFTIFGYNGSELWVDNVRLYGVNRDDLMP